MSHLWLCQFATHRIDYKLNKISNTDNHFIEFSPRLHNVFPENKEFVFTKFSIVQAKHIFLKILFNSRNFENGKFSFVTVYPKKYAHGFCFAVLCCGYTLTDFPISIRLTSLALWQSNDCPIASKATLMNMDKYFIWIHYERLHNHNKAKHNKTVCIFLGIYSIWYWLFVWT